MELFHIVPSGIFKRNSNMGCREHCKLSKMSKNSLISFLSRENRRDEFRVLSLELQAILWWTNSKFKVVLHNLYFTGLKLVRYSIINGLHNCYRYHSKHSMQGPALYPFWKKVHIAILIQWLFAQNLFLSLTLVLFWSYMYYNTREMV